MADPTNSELKLLLHFDGADASTSFPDSSINGHIFTVVGNAQVDTAESKFGGASGLFDGTGDSISAPFSSDFDMGSGDFTLECWFRAASISSAMKLCGMGDINANFDEALIIRIDDEGFVKYIADGSNEVFGSVAISINSWNHVAMVRDGGTLRAFLNGVDDGTAVISGAISTPVFPFIIGVGNVVGFDYFNGHIDDFRLSKGVALYTTGFTPPTSAFPDPANSPAQGIVTVAGLSPALTNGHILQAQIEAIITNGNTPFFSNDLADIESVFITGGSPSLVVGYNEAPQQLVISLLGSNPLVKPGQLSIFGLGLIPTFPFKINLSLEQTIANPTGDVVLSIDQFVSDTGNASFLFQQNVYVAASVSDSWDNWDVSVIVDGVDKSSDLTGQMTVDAEISSARVATFTLKLSGTVNPNDWIGKNVEINYIQNNGAVWRRFSGIIESPEYDISTKTLQCGCTDQLQKIVNGYENDALKTLTGGYWHQNVFNKDNIGWDYLNDLLQTVNKSVHLSSSKQLVITDLQNQLVADFSFDDDLILDNSLSVEMTERNQLINKVEIKVNARYQRLFQRDSRFIWVHPRELCEESMNPVTFPTQAMVKDAVEDGGRALTNAAYTPLWPSGLYNCSPGQIIFTNLTPNSVRGFNITTGFRWNQEITEEFNIDVISPESVILDGGELIENSTASLDFETNRPDWDDPVKSYSAESGLIPDGLGNKRRNDFSDMSVDELVEVMIAKASTTILQSHSQNTVLFQLPLSPYIELGDTVSAVDPDVACKGIVRRFSETYDFNTGTPITSLEISISLGGSGLDSTINTVAAPTRLDLSDGGDVDNVFFVDTHIGGLPTSPPEDPNMTGVILNVDSKFQLPYDSGLKIPFESIDDSIRENSIEPSDFEIKIAVPDNQLTITA